MSMFDLATFELENSIIKYNQKKLLEDQKVKADEYQKMIESALDVLVKEYNNLFESETSKIIERKFIRDAAVIEAVKDAVYGVFESALLLDESAKIEYRDSIKMIFESYFYQILKENNIKSLSQFKTFVKDANGIFEAVIDRAEKFVEINEAVYNELLETTYNSTSLDNLIIEAATASADPEASVDDKVSKAKAMVDKLTQDFQRFTLEQRFASAHKIIQAAIIILKLGVAIDKIWYSLLDKLLTAINSIFGRESTESLKEKLMNKTLKEVENYYYVAIDVAITLKKLQKKFPPDSKDYIKLGDRIASIYKAIIIINNYRQELINKTQNKPLKEMSYVEFITESDAAVADEVSQKNIIDSLKEKINDCITEFEPYEALENLKLVNQIISDNSYHHTFINHGNDGSNPIILIIKALKHPNVDDKLRNQFMKEAKEYKNNLDSVITSARKLGKNDEVTRMVKQSKRLDSILKQCEEKGCFEEKFIRENFSPLFSIGYKESMENMVSNINESIQFLMIYEAEAKDIEYITQLVNECDEFHDETKENLKILGRIAREEIDESKVSNDIVNESVKLEAAIYKKLYMSSPDGISEAAANELKMGRYPKLKDFLDEDEKKLLDAVVSASGKDKIVDIIKDKVVDVIESEEKRVEKLEEERQKLISRLSKKMPEGGEELQEAVKNTTLKVPTTLFEAIVMNRSKKYIQESVSLGMGFDLKNHESSIMGEAITLYTIHETFNTLKFGKYDSSKINKLTNDYYYGKI